MANHKINSVAAAPTVYRALRALPSEVVQKYSQDIHLQPACSAGEPLPPAVSQWFQEHFGVPILNHYGQTENGMMVNQNRTGPHKWQEEMDNRSITGSHHSTMGTPMEGFQGACLLDSDGQVITEEGTEGELCMKLDDCPLFWFSGYYQSDKSVIDKDGYYHTGDRARLAQTSSGETTFAYSSRDDDIINMAGYRVGPTEIETSIMQLSFVVEVGVIGVPDDIKGEAIVAFVVVSNDDRDDNNTVESEIKEHVKRTLAKHLTPHHVEMVTSLPRTESGKVKRFLLREQWASSKESGGL